MKQSWRMAKFICRRKWSCRRRPTVYVVVPEVIVEMEKPPLVVHVRSPRLKDPAMAALFRT